MIDLRRTFQLEDQWCVIYLPARPNGFACMLFGDITHYVEQETCSWRQHPEREQFIRGLLHHGYTVITSNFFGRHWGSEQATKLALRLYHLSIKREILNPSIHLIGEGMGALLAMNVMEEMPDRIRSGFFINPCLDLVSYYDQEKANKLFYKRFLIEMAAAHEVSTEDVEPFIYQYFNNRYTNLETPMHIFHEMNERRYPVQSHSKPFQLKAERENRPVTLTLRMAQKSFSSLIDPAYQFFRKHEKKLS
ncbi:alpha/beta hydrolase [Halalkalibacterium halodurans]|uniref:BH2892 protein n=1 Tax=Halalkalibacterium halodurans (strain ATCC BAA-125 / DSM 18197 / FERM 7344 / JCM 9153 / C-125) TaxID=272558 RepID=Q9K8W0_HALH5|nr:alpha/beta hydrolase [Halalkalibacterium halodurans]MED4081627.1 alpha/beta hydrolase [Halalkalibacterium halodurans]MED4084961.1 alpha/beta hydrolase [Halalkalibacterium halodurans]MED4104152.1 alpha/beta hydrolase [Halalkalibacterium halodurans]MED4110530.1 alpha/beta hydrolase [Halalkalibacterium halodurans]MED4126417.1 alpha/beta hydrolase [Halalkalibacterium halodurans]